MFIIADGVLLSRGCNTYGQLGLGDYKDRENFERVNNDNYFVMVSCLYDHTIALDIDGNLWGCGYNGTGALGLDTDTEHYNEFIRIPSLTTFKFVTCSDLHSIALDIDGNIWACGSDTAGLLGNNNVDVPIFSINIFIKINTEIKFRYLSFTNNDSRMAIDTKGNLWGSGFNWEGELGLGHDNIVSNFTKVDSATFMCNNGYIISTDTTFNYVECGGKFTIAIDVDGNLSGCGTMYTISRDDNGNILGYREMYNLGSRFNQISNGVKFTKVSCGDNYFVAIDDTGCLWGYGGNVYSQLGLGHNNNINELTKITSDRTFTAVSCIRYETYALDSEGNVWTCGKNKNVNILTMIDNVKADFLANNHITKKIPTKGSHKF